MELNFLRCRGIGRNIKQKVGQIVAAKPNLLGEYLKISVAFLSVGNQTLNEHIFRHGEGSEEKENESMDICSSSGGNRQQRNNFLGWKPQKGIFCFLGTEKTKNGGESGCGGWTLSVRRND